VTDRARMTARDFIAAGVEFVRVDGWIVARGSAGPDADELREQLRFEVAMRRELVGSDVRYARCVPARNRCDHCGDFLPGTRSGGGCELCMLARKKNLQEKQARERGAA
jgi:hypothetical protein